MNTRSIVRFVAPACLAAFGGFANAQLFDFEGEVATGVSAGGYTTLTMVSGAQSVTITRMGGTAFDVTDNVGTGKPASWGDRSMSPFHDSSGSPFILDFALGITFFSIMAGDYEPSDDDEVVISAYAGAGGTGTLLGTTGGSLPSDTSGFDFDVYSFGGSPPAMSIVLSGGSAGFPQSLFWDNIHVESVPEPATMTVLALGAAAAMRRRKKV